MATKPKDLTGTIIKLEEYQKKFVDHLIKARRTADVAFSKATEMAENTEKAMWKALHDIIPETKNHHYNYNSEKGEIRFIAKKTKLKED